MKSQQTQSHKYNENQKKMNEQINLLLKTFELKNRVPLKMINAINSKLQVIYLIDRIAFQC